MYLLTLHHSDCMATDRSDLHILICIVSLTEVSTYSGDLGVNYLYLPRKFNYMKLLNMSWSLNFVYNIYIYLMFIH